MQPQNSATLQMTRVFIFFALILAVARAQSMLFHESNYEQQQQQYIVLTLRNYTNGIIQGDAKNRHFPNLIQLVSFQFNYSRVIGSVGHGPPPVGPLQASTFTISKHIDKASPIILQHLSMKYQFQGAEIDLWRRDDNNVLRKFCSFTVSQSTISEYKVQTENGQNTETLKLKFFNLYMSYEGGANVHVFAA